jgi:hypothetical protein
LTLTRCGGFSGRKIVNEGHMALHGARPAMVWSVLRYTAAAGAWKLTVQGDAGWQADDVILVASTGDDESQTETRTLLAAQLVPAPGGGWDTEVGLDAPLTLTLALALALNLNPNPNPNPKPNLNPNPDPNPDPDPDPDPNPDPNPDPDQVGLDAPLAHAHHGETEVHSGHTLELRAEVGV